MSINFSSLNINLTQTFGLNRQQMLGNMMSGLSNAGPAAGAQVLNFFGDNFSAQSISLNVGVDEFAAPAPVPAPSVGLSGPPAGQGLQKNPKGWPEGSVRTAGGYTVVPEGNTRWKIYNPDQREYSKKLEAGTEIWGDPHVKEADGGRWDFTKSSDFVLPDGTRIAAKTSSEKGKSVTTGLDITNGADHVAVTGVNGKPTTSAVQHDGYEWRAQHMASNPNRDTFKMGGNGDDWFMVKNGRNVGEVTGAHHDKQLDEYVQHVDGKAYNVDPSLRPQFGSDAWGNMLRNQSLDFVSGRLGMDPWSARGLGAAFHQDHAYTQMFNNMMRMAPYSGPFGGMFGMAFGFEGMFGAMSGMSDAMNSLHELNTSQYIMRNAMLF